MGKVNIVIQTDIQGNRLYIQGEHEGRFATVEANTDAGKRLGGIINFMQCEPCSKREECPRVDAVVDGTLMLHDGHRLTLTNHRSCLMVTNVITHIPVPPELLTTK